MGSFRFRRSIKLAPGIKLNLNKKSVSLTGGVRGAHATRSFGGRSNYSVGVPGTGLWYRGYLGSKRASQDRKQAERDERFQEALREATAPEGTHSAKVGNFNLWLGGLFMILVPTLLVAAIAGANIGLVCLAVAAVWTAGCIAMSIRRTIRVHRRRTRHTPFVSSVAPLPPSPSAPAPTSGEPPPPPQDLVWDRRERAFRPRTEQDTPGREIV